MNETIERTSRATNYQDIKKKCLEDIQVINKQTIDIQLGV